MQRFGRRRTVCIIEISTVYAYHTLHAINIWEIFGPPLRQKVEQIADEGNTDVVLVGHACYPCH